MPWTCGTATPTSKSRRSGTQRRSASTAPTSAAASPRCSTWAATRGRSISRSAPPTAPPLRASWPRVRSSRRSTSGSTSLISASSFTCRMRPRCAPRCAPTRPGVPRRSRCGTSCRPSRPTPPASPHWCTPRGTRRANSGWSGPVDAEFLTLARRGGTIYVPTLTVPDGYRQVAARRFERDLQPLACVDPATRAKALATDTVAPAQRPSDSAVAERTARTARTLAQGLANLKRVYDAGIPVALGTDAGNPLTLHGASVFAELEAMQAAGLRPVDVLLAATRNAARAAGVALDSAGTLTAGAVADLVVLDADPLTDIRNVRRIALVARSGEIYTRRELEYR